MGYFKTIPYELEECALVGSLPLVVPSAFFVEHYVAATTGAVKE